MGLNQFKTRCGGIQFPKGNPHLSLGLEPGFALPALPPRMLAQLGWACGSRFQDILPASCPFPRLGKALCLTAHHPGNGILLASPLPLGWGALGMLQPSPGDVTSLGKGAGMENPQIPHVLGVLPAPPAPAAGCRWLWIHRCSTWMSRMPAGGNLPTPHPAAPGCIPIPHPLGVPRDVPVPWNAPGCPCPHHSVELGAVWLELRKRWGLSGEGTLFPNPGGCLERLGMVPLALMFFSPPI